ncbi:MAG: DUF1592 domain-containing protein [Planctomycetota bacterium]|nr:DUF1592 domain-containing protein [Planctomycetota bacterium]
MIYNSRKVGSQMRADNRRSAEDRNFPENDPCLMPFFPQSIRSSRRSAAAISRFIDCRLRGSLLRLAVVLLVMPALCLEVFSQQQSRAGSREAEKKIKATFGRDIRPILKKHCYRCHNLEEMESGIRVDHLDGSLLAGPAGDRQLVLWESIRKLVARQEMPPEDQPQPTDAEREKLEEWISGMIEFARSRPVPRNGSTRRLTVKQYENTLKNLLGIQDNLTELLPPDAISRDGFVNDEKSMLLSPLLLEAYFEIAQKALDLAVVDPEQRPVIQNFRMELGRNRNPVPFSEKLILGANSKLLRNDEFLVRELQPEKPFPFTPFRMQTRFRYIEGYRGNATVRGWKDFDSIYHAVFACVRGNGGYPKGLPYQTVPDGLLLRPAIPSRELFGVESTYGPRANFKIALRELPEQGNFRVRIRAAKYCGGLLLDRGERPAPGAVAIRSEFSGPQKMARLQVKKPGIYEVNLLSRPQLQSPEPADASRLQQDLAGAWSFEKKFDEDAGTPELAGSPEGGARIVETPFGSGVSLDGSDDAVVVKRNDRMNVGVGEFSVAAWIHPRELRQSGIVCLGKYSWTHGWYLDMPNNQGVLRIETASPQNRPNGTVQSGKGVIRAGKWQHVAAVVSRKTNQTRLYVNGYEVARGSIAATNLDNPKVDLQIGRIQDSVHFKGDIDEVRFYRRALKPQEIQALLVGGKRFIQPPPPAKPGRIDLVWKQGESPPRELAGVLYQPGFARIRLEAGELSLSAKTSGQPAIQQVELVEVDEASEIGQRYLAFEKRNPRLGVYVGLRRDCGHTLAPVGPPREVGNQGMEEFVFQGAINNFPSPDVEKNNVNYLAGVREIGVRSEYTDGKDTPRLLIQSIEFEGPYYESWPPRSHRAIFFDSPNSKDRQVYAREVLEKFSSRAFRRPVTHGELESLMAVFRESFRQTDDFQSSVQDALLVVLTSPQFLFLLEKSESPQPERLGDFELASKLSYFLWNTAPDSQLLERARQGRLQEVLEKQVDRMIKDPRFENFCEPFCSQWLQLDKFDVVEIDRKRFPLLTRDTRRQLRREPVEFIRYLFRENLPVRNLVHSEFVLANDVTAAYYGLSRSPESGFRFEAVPKDGVALGGLLGQAAILSGLSDGRESNPIKRGAWLARKIIAEPPADPPPNVPELGAETENLPLRQRLEIHRNQKGCVKCHSGIDPWGLPFEQFDAAGRFSGKPNPNAQSMLPDQTMVNGFLDLRSYLAEKRMNQVAFSFAKHLTTYAIGRSLTYNELQRLKKRCFSKQLGKARMREILLLVVKSEMFLTK